MSNTDRSAGARTAQLHCRACGPSIRGSNPITWSQFPATQNVNMGCNCIVDVSGIYFCDGTYIGHGNSFDISSNQNIVIKTTDNVITLQRSTTGSGIVTSASLSDDGAVQIGALGVTTIPAISLQGPVHEARIQMNDQTLEIAGELSAFSISTADNIVFNTPAMYVTNPNGDVILNLSGEGDVTATAHFSNTGSGGTTIFGLDPSQGGAIIQSDTNVTINPTVDLVLGTNLLTTSAGGASGNFLRIKIGSNYYKLALLADT